MKPLHKGLMLAVLHLGLVTSLGAKLLYDRATLPRVWGRAAPYDPELPIRGRYVRLRLEVHTRGIAPEEDDRRERQLVYRLPRRVLLSAENGQLVASPDPAATGQPSYTGEGNSVHFEERAGFKIAVLSEPVLYFIPEHVTDPSRRTQGEELWVEVTLPKKGPPRPIRLAVRKDGTFTPLDLD